MKAELGLDWEEEMASARPHDCVSVPSDHPLYVLYTSGTTGAPKVAATLPWLGFALDGNPTRFDLCVLQGIVRDTGGYAVMLNWTMSNVYGLDPGDVSPRRRRGVSAPAGADLLLVAGVVGGVGPGLGGGPLLHLLRSSAPRQQHHPLRGRSPLPRCCCRVSYSC